MKVLVLMITNIGLKLNTVETELEVMGCTERCKSLAFVGRSFDLCLSTVYLIQQERTKLETMYEMLEICSGGLYQKNEVQ